MRLRSILLALAVILAPAYGQYGGELRFYLQGEPKTFKRLLVEEDPSEVVRYLTGGVPIRVNRSTQEVEPSSVGCQRPTLFCRVHERAPAQPTPAALGPQSFHEYPGPHHHGPYQPGPYQPVPSTCEIAPWIHLIGCKKGKNHCGCHC